MSIQPGVGYTFNASSQGSNLTIEKPWAPWATYATAEDPGHPFKIVNAQIVTSGGSSYVSFQVQSGTINNLVPLLMDLASGTGIKLDRTTAGVPNPPNCQLYSGNFDATTKTSYIELRAGPSLSSGDYPDPDVSTNQYPIIDGGNTAPATPDDNVFGFLVIGTITVDNITAPTAFTVNQNVTGSLWADRLKLGTATATYYYARI
jgi:hypothetical protein